MAGISGLTLVWIMVSVIASVLMRNFGLQPFAWLFTSAEYGLLYMTMLGAPWLVREKGHVHIELLTSDPRWLLSITFPLSFGLMAVEFSRFVFGSELMHSGEAGIHE